MRLTIGAKIFAGFLLVMLLFVGVSAFALGRLAQISHRLSAGPLQLELALKIADLDKTQQQLSRVVATGRDKTTYWRKARMQTLGEARSLAGRSGLPGVAPRISTLVMRVDENERAYAALEAGANSEGGAASAAGTPAGPAAGSMASIERREEMLSHDVRTLRLDVEEQTGQIAIEIDREGRRLLYLVLVLVVLATLLGAIVTFGAHAALRPLAGLTRHAYALGSGDYSLRIAVRGRDEIAELGSAFNAMAQALEQREQQVIRSERLAAVGRMAAQIAHEIRNPLSSIGLNVELLEEEVAAGLQPHPLAQNEAGPRTPAMAKSLHAISKEVDRLTEITEQYLRLARLPTPKREPEDLAEIVRSLVEFYRPECGRKNIEIALEASPITVQADENQIRQALLNLLRNAAEAMPEGGRISVSVGEDAGGGLVRIADQGPGIAPEQRHRIFEPFFSTKQGGTGLGLALAHEIARQHGGSLTVEAEPSPPAETPRGATGATFVLRLPGGRLAGQTDAAVTPPVSVPPHL